MSVVLTTSPCLVEYTNCYIHAVPRKCEKEMIDVLSMIAEHYRYSVLLSVAI